MEVTLLTQDECSFCEQAKHLLARLSGDYPISVSTVDLNSDAGRELGERFGVMFPPGVLIDGDPVAYGRQSERRLRREIKKRLGH